MKKISRAGLGFIAGALLLGGIFSAAPVTLFAQGVPAPSVAVSALDLYDTSVTFHGTVSGGSNLSVGVIFGSAKSSLTGYAGFVSGPAGEFLLVLKALQPGTTYYYQFVTDNGFRQEIGSVASFTTKSTLLDLSAQNISQTKATITGRISSSNVKILWGPASADTPSGSFTPSRKADGTFSQDISPLAPGTTYDVLAVRASDNVQISGVHEFRTADIAVTPYIAQVSDMSATISATGSAGIKSLDIFYGTDESNMPGVGMTLSGGVYSAKLTGLIPDTGYFYKLRITAADSAGTTSESAVYSFLTQKKAEAAPAPIATIGGSSSADASRKVSNSLIPCSGVDEPTSDNTGAPAGRACTFADIITLVKNIIDRLLFIVAPIIATLVILYAGILILTSNGSEEKVTKAKGLIGKVLGGFLLALGAWIIVKFVLITLGYNDSVFPHFY